MTVTPDETALIVARIFRRSEFEVARMTSVQPAMGEELVRMIEGGHYLVRLNGRVTTVPVHGDADYDPRFFDDICKQLNTRLENLR